MFRPVPALCIQGRYALLPLLQRVGLLCIAAAGDLHHFDL
jgi:hypothetical protein